MPEDDDEATKYEMADAALGQAVAELAPQIVELSHDIHDHPETGYEEHPAPAPGAQLAHRGFAQGIVVAEKIAGLDPTPVDDVLVPKVTFCEPEIASVGLSEAKAAEIHGKENITSAEFNVAGNAKSQILGTQGFVKLVSLKDGPILGFHAIGARMGEQVGEGQLMVSWEADADDVAACIVWTLELPAHVNIDSMVVRPRAQASNTLVAREQ